MYKINLIDSKYKLKTGSFSPPEKVLFQTLHSADDNASAKMCL